MTTPSSRCRSEEEVHARHILVPTEDEAKAILADLKKGADFATLAKEKSKDPGAADGGDLGYFTKDQMVPEFSAVAFKLDKGQLSDPVKTQFGWHIIKVEDKRVEADADLRSGQGPDRDLCRAPRPGRAGREAARARQYRAHGQARGAGAGAAGSSSSITGRRQRRSSNRDSATLTWSCPALMAGASRRFVRRDFRRGWRPGMQSPAFALDAV